MTLVNRVSAFFLAALAIALIGYSAVFYFLMRDYLYREFDDKLRSSLHILTAERIVVRFWDRLEVQGQSHLYTSRQQLTFSPDGRIVRIVHEEIPGERKALDGFLVETAR